MIVYTEAPTVLVYWRGRGTADAVGEAIAGHVEKDTTPSLGDDACPPMRGLPGVQAVTHGCG